MNFRRQNKNNNERLLLLRRFSLRYQWLHFALLLITMYLFFVWVATQSMSDADGNNNGSSSSSEDGTAEFVDTFDESQVAAPVHTDDTNDAAPPRCAINLFGLPRSFESMVLPSLTRNVFVRNARHGCDYFVHYYHREDEPGGRAGSGGHLNPDEVLLMKGRIKAAALRAKFTLNREPMVFFVKDTEEDFWRKRGTQVEKYRTTKDAKGHYLYYPWKAGTYHYPESLDNIVKQWHSIQSAWEAMEEFTKQSGRPKYDRVAMMRLDVLYALPVDIYQPDKNEFDKENKIAVSPGFAKYPVNDRLFYGPYEAVKIWATERFDRLEEHVKTYEPGWGMHSERFLESAIFGAIKEKGIEMRENPDICVMRVRADESVWMNDCITNNGSTRGMRKMARQKLIERLLDRTCTKSKLKRRVIQLRCPMQSQQQQTVERRQ